MPLFAQATGLLAEWRARWIGAREGRRLYAPDKWAVQIQERFPSEKEQQATYREQLEAFHLCR